jgi:hypothetical protein
MKKVYNYVFFKLKIKFYVMSIEIRNGGLIPQSWVKKFEANFENET